jgi:hypothetical protein
MPTPRPARGGLVRPASRRFLACFAIIFVTLAATEVLLRMLDVRYLRDSARPGDSDTFRFDSEIGWAPIPNSTAITVGSRPFRVCGSACLTNAL